MCVLSIPIMKNGVPTNLMNESRRVPTISCILSNCITIHFFMAWQHSHSSTNTLEIINNSLCNPSIRNPTCLFLVMIKKHHIKFHALTFQEMFLFLLKAYLAAFEPNVVDFFGNMPIVLKFFLPKNN